MAEHNDDQPHSRRRGRCPKEFKRDVAALVIDQRCSIADIARGLGVVDETLGNRVRQERIGRGEREGTTTDARAENAQLHREVQRQATARDLLKRSVALGVKELGRRAGTGTSSP